MIRGDVHKYDNIRLFSCLTRIESSLSKLRLNVGLFEQQINSMLSRRPVVWMSANSINYKSIITLSPTMRIGNLILQPRSYE